MKIIDSLRDKPHSHKIRLIWIAVTIVALAMIVLWIFTSRIGEKFPKDTSLFQTFGKGVNNIRDQYSNDKNEQK